MSVNNRYLIHEVLAKAGFTPRGIILPVSAVILANLDEYVEILENFSRLGFDRARTRLNDIHEWPGQSLDLFIRVVHQNDNKLSKTKRGSHFDWMTDEEIRTSEAVVVAEFKQNQE